MPTVLVPLFEGFEEIEAINYRRFNHPNGHGRSCDRRDCRSTS